MRLQELPNPQIYTRQERYRAQPPHVLEPWGFHSENSLAVYQGLVYYLLSLHSKYDKVSAVRVGAILPEAVSQGLLSRRTAAEGGAEQSRLGASEAEGGPRRGSTSAQKRWLWAGGGGGRSGRKPGWGAGTEARDTACLGTPLDIPTPSPRCLQFLQPYADPVHDPTWRWWKNKKQDQVRGEDGESGEGAEHGSPPHRPPVRALTLPRTLSPRITTSTWPTTGGARAVCTLT